MELLENCGGSARVTAAAVRRWQRRWDVRDSDSGGGNKQHQDDHKVTVR